MKTISHIIIAILICVSFPAFAADGDVKGNGQDILVKNGRLWIDVKDMEISDVLKEIGKKAKIDISIDKNIQGKITLKTSNAALENILKRICRNRSIIYEYITDKKTYKIIGVGAYFSEKGRGSKTSGRIAKQPVKGEKSGEILQQKSESVKNIRENAAIKKSGKMYDSKGRLLYKPGELLVKFKKGVTEAQIQKLNESLGSKVLKILKRIRLYRIKLRKGLSENQAIQLYLESGLVEIAEKHALRYPSSTVPNDTYFNDQWALGKIQAPHAWDTTTGSSDIIIAVIDTGVDYLHPDLMDNIWINKAEANGAEGVDDDDNGYVDDIYGWDCADNDSNPIGTDSHGTHVAGIIGARGNNSIGVTGVNWNLKIMVLKVQSDYSDEMKEVDIIEAIDYAIANGARVVNCSFGGSYDPQTFNNEIAAFGRLKSAGILAVCAAGNEAENNDNNPEYPASYDLDNIISVAASDTNDYYSSNSNDFLAVFSNYGLVSVDVMAPGVNIKSTVPARPYTEASVYAGDITYNAIGMGFAGTTDASGITANLYDCGKGYNDEFPEGINGNIALIERGDRDGIAFYFYQKVINAQNHGAIGTIIYDNFIDNHFDQNGGSLVTPGDWIPAIAISQENGQALINIGLPQAVTLVNKSVSGPSSYSYMDGTSMATPVVSGIAGLILSKYSKYPDLGYSYVKSAILDSVDKIDSVSDKLISGGRVNAWSALCSINIIQGDLSCDGRIDLNDAIIAMQIISGSTPDICSALLNSGFDVNGDNRIGMEEAIYILQKLSTTP